MARIHLWPFTIILALLVVLILVPFTLAFSPAVSVAGGNLRNEFLVVKPDFGGNGYDQFFPQTIVVNAGDQLNMTIRNPDDEGFQLVIENTTTVNIGHGLTGSDGSVTPVDTVTPVFTASTAGIFRFYAVGHADMDGYLVVLPSDWSSYNPPSQERRLHTLALPDFAGDGYDKFFPETLAVNQGDTVDISVRNMDEASHGFGLPGYGIDVAVRPAQSLPNGTIAPVERCSNIHRHYARDIPIHVHRPLRAWALRDDWRACRAAKRERSIQPGSRHRVPLFDRHSGFCWRWL